jgi:predicted nucleic acid-binding protein
MAQTVFLDTNVMLDYLENRNKEVRDVVAQLLLYHKKGRIVLATSVFNVAEIIDKEFEIHFMGWCVNERMSFDEISSRRREEKLFKEISEKNKNNIEKRIKGFIFENNIILFTFSGESPQYKELYDLIYQRQLQSQDALVVATALANKVTYFLSNDSNLISKIGEMLDTYNLRDEGLRKAFRDDVLEAI